MSARLSAVDVVTRSIRRIGEIAPHEEPSGEALARGLEELDTVIADALADRRCWWFVRNDLEFPLQEGEPTYPVDRVGEEQVLGVLDCQATKTTGYRVPVDVVPLREFEFIDRPLQTGFPEVAAITRNAQQTSLSFWPVPNAAYPIQLTVSVEAPDVTGGQSGADTGLRPTWHGWAIEATAARIAAGPVRFLPLQEQALLERRANARLEQLLNFDNRAPRTRTAQTKRYFD